MVVRKEEAHPKGRLDKVRTFTQLNLKEMLAKRDSWGPEKEPHETSPRKGETKAKRKRSSSQTPPQDRSKVSQEGKKNPVPTPVRKRRKPRNVKEGNRNQEMEENSGDLTPVRKLLKEKRVVVTKLKRLKDVREKEKEKEESKGGME